jgi:hypothetical protein
MFALGQLNALADGGWLICGLALECQKFYWDGLAMVGAQDLHWQLQVDDRRHGRIRTVCWKWPGNTIAMDDVWMLRGVATGTSLKL